MNGNFSLCSDTMERSPACEVRADPPVLALRDRTAEAAAPAIVSALNVYPYHVVLRGLEPVGDRAPAENIIRAIAGDCRLSFTRVRIDPIQTRREDRVTRYSRTHLALPPHTDSAYSSRPHSLVAFLMVRGDAGRGGRSIVVPVTDVVSRLDEDMQAALREPVFAFGKKDLPILWRRKGDESMRYYRAQIDTALRLRGTRTGTAGGIMDRLDHLLAELAEDRGFALRNGDLLLLNNHQVLHGRTAFAPDSDRLMFRFRARATVLE